MIWLHALWPWGSAAGGGSFLAWLVMDWRYERKGGRMNRIWREGYEAGCDDEEKSWLAGDSGRGGIPPAPAGHRYQEVDDDDAPGVPRGRLPEGHSAEILHVPPALARAGAGAPGGDPGALQARRPGEGHPRMHQRDEGGHSEPEWEPGPTDTVTIWAGKPRDERPGPVVAARVPTAGNERTSGPGYDPDWFRAGMLFVADWRRDSWALEQQGDELVAAWMAESRHALDAASWPNRMLEAPR